MPVDVSVTSDLLRAMSKDLPEAKKRLGQSQQLIHKLRRRLLDRQVQVIAKEPGFWEILDLWGDQTHLVDEDPHVGEHSREGRFVIAGFMRLDEDIVLEIMPSDSAFHRSWRFPHRRYYRIRAINVHQITEKPQ